MKSNLMSLDHHKVPLLPSPPFSSKLIHVSLISCSPKSFFFKNLDVLVVYLLLNKNYIFLDSKLFPPATLLNAPDLLACADQVIFTSEPFSGFEC